MCPGAGVSVRHVVLLLLVPVVVSGQATPAPPPTLPPAAAAALVRAFDASASHAWHPWRDTPALNADRTVNVYVEISQGDRRKWELDIAENRREIDRVMPEDVGGYPVNYGFVPQTVSYDGDPFDALVLGPPLPGGTLVRGVIVGLMLMEDDGLVDSKVVVSRVDAGAGALDTLDAAEQARLGDFFNRYKRHEPRAVTRVPGWGSAADGLAHVEVTHGFYRNRHVRRTVIGNRTENPAQHRN